MSVVSINCHVTVIAGRYIETVCFHHLKPNGLSSNQPFLTMRLLMWNTQNICLFCEHFKSGSLGRIKMSLCRRYANLWDWNLCVVELWVWRQLKHLPRPGLSKWLVAPQVSAGNLHLLQDIFLLLALSLSDLISIQSNQRPLAANWRFSPKVKGGTSYTSAENIHLCCFNTLPSSQWKTVRQANGDWPGDNMVSQVSLWRLKSLHSSGSSNLPPPQAPDETLNCSHIMTLPI